MLTGIRHNLCFTLVVLGIEYIVRDTFFLKVFLGGLTTPEVLLRHIAQFREDIEARLVVYRAIGRTNTNTGHDWYHRHLLRYGIERAEYELEWTARVTRALRRGPR